MRVGHHRPDGRTDTDAMSRGYTSLSGRQVLGLSPCFERRSEP